MVQSAVRGILGVRGVLGARWVLVFVLAVVSSLSLSACGKRDGVLEGTVRGADPSTAQIQVVVYDLERSDEVQGINVFQKGTIVQKAVLKETGTFAFTLPPQEYILQVWVNGIEVVDQMVEVRSGRTTTLDLEVTPPPS